MKVQYPTRCRILDIDGQRLGSYLRARTPAVSKPHIGKIGTAEKPNGGIVKIRLDDGNVVMGWDCWWEPVDEAAEAGGSDGV